MNPVFQIAVGTEAEATTMVTKELTMRHFHPGMPEVYGTPFMIHLMEIAAGNAVHPCLPAGWISVGIDVKIRHLVTTPVGRIVTARARVTQVTRKLIEFEVQAHDGKNLIGKGTLSRAPVNLARFGKNLHTLSNEHDVQPCGQTRYPCAI